MKTIGQKIGDFFTKGIIPIFTGIQWLKIPVGTYVRWILTILLSVNTILTYCGVNPISVSENQLYDIVSVVLNVVVLIYNTYKNNSTSKEALIADELLRALKVSLNSDEDKAIDKINEILAELNGEDFIPEDKKEDTPVE